jgi:ribosomal-protein-alanine N-acetyltransferase
MNLDDIDAVMEVETICFSIPWSRKSFEDEIGNNENAHYVIARIEERIVGYGGMWKVLNEGHITNIAVHPELRRQRIGSFILDALLRFADGNRIDSLTLEVRESNIAARMLYEKYGFYVEGRRKAYYVDNMEDAIIMWKK